MHTMAERSINSLWRKIVIIGLMDILSVIASYFFALMLRFDFKFGMIPEEYIEGYLDLMPYWCAVTFAVFLITKLYHSIWSFAGISELWMIMKAYLILIPAYVVCVFLSEVRMPRSYYAIGLVLNFCLSTNSIQ